MQRLGGARVIRGLFRTARAVAGAGLCAVGNAIVLAGVKLVGELPDLDHRAPPWDDDAGYPEIVGAVATSETTLYLVPRPDEGKTVTSAPASKGPPPLEGSAEWRREQARRSR
jgi:hypothetical protein